MLDKIQKGRERKVAKSFSINKKTLEEFEKLAFKNIKKEDQNFSYLMEVLIDEAIEKLKEEDSSS